MPLPCWKQRRSRWGYCPFPSRIHRFGRSGGRISPRRSPDHASIGPGSGRFAGSNTSFADDTGGGEGGCSFPMGRPDGRNGQVGGRSAYCAISRHAFCRGKICRLRRSVQRFAEGYDLADLATVSTAALYKEWSGEEDSSEYRVDGGYGRLVDYLVHDQQWATDNGACSRWRRPRRRWRDSPRCSR